MNTLPLPSAAEDASAYVQRIDGLLRQLGIPADYASRRGMTLQPDAKRLVSIGTSDDGADVRLAPAAAAAWKTMEAAADHDGVRLIPVSGYRSVDRQAEIIRRRLARGDAVEVVLGLIAAPGYSEHHTGRAIDIGTPGEPPLLEGFAETDAYRWLSARAPAFGFTLSYPRDNPHGFAFEPWHWCFQG
jgi:D-alanyl-D-alanine carboxypeptidase